MNKIIKIFFVFLIASQANAQELNARVTINSDNIPNSNKQVFETLERDLTEFINQKKWTNINYKSQERIDCAFTLILLEQPSTNEFRGSIQIQSARPVYNSSYLSSIFNYKDNDFSFRYTEYEIFEYDVNRFDSNLVSVIAFYVYTLLGIDADSFAENGGTIYFDEAENVMNQAQQSGYAGWSPNSSGVSRYKVITEILSPAYTGFRDAIFEYHFRGLDIMYEDKMAAKENILKSVEMLKPIYERRPNSPLIRIFMDAKADEIVNVFSGGPRFETDDLKDDLMRLSPSNVSKWNKMK